MTPMPAFQATAHVHPLNIEVMRRFGIRRVVEQSIADSNGGDGEASLVMGDADIDTITIKTNRSPGRQPTAARYLYVSCSDGLDSIQVKLPGGSYRPLAAMAPDGWLALDNEPSSGEATTIIYFKNNAGAPRTIWYAAAVYEYPAAS